MAADYEEMRPSESGAGAGSHIDDESAQLVLLQRDDFMVARLLRKLEQGARRRQPQPRHVRLAVDIKNKRC